VARPGIADPLGIRDSRGFRSHRPQKPYERRGKRPSRGCAQEGVRRVGRTSLAGPEEGEGRASVTLQTRDEAMLAISLLAAVGSACLYVPAVRHRAWAAVWAFGATLFVFGIIAVVMLARVLREMAP
jgi:hypothetical protein